MKKTKRIILVLMTILLMVIGTTIVSASTTYVYNKGDWKVRLDSPNTDGKTYWHLHFYQKGKHVYCFIQILYLIFDYPHKHYTFKYFEV